MKKLIIAEKPSLGRNIATALNLRSRKNGYIEGDNYIVSWAFGHLFQLNDVDDYIGKKTPWKDAPIPYIPKKFKFKLKTNEGISQQFKVLKTLMKRKDVDGIINCGDADREGQIIVDRIISEAKCKKDVFRLWLPEQTTETIKEEVAKLKPNSEYNLLAQEGYSRTILDWLFGINLTRFITLKSGSLMPVGRVLIPVLKFVYDRDMEIKNFIPQTYYQLESPCSIDKIEFKLTHKKKFKPSEMDKLEETLEKVNSFPGEVLDVVSKEVKKQPPKLFSLSTLQGALSKKFKINFKTSLDIIQGLYEKGLITYPRTNTEYLSTKEIGKVKGLIKVFSKEHDLKFRNSKKIFDDSKVESHSAIIPTTKTPKNNLGPQEAKIYGTILNRFLANFVKEDTITGKTTIKIGVGKDRYTLSGETVIQKGFLIYEPISFKNSLPKVNKGDQFKVNFSKIEKSTTPPKKVSEQELSNHLKNPFKKDGDSEAEEYKAILSGIEIGTEATRTGIMENAKRYNYLSQVKSTFSVEPLGIQVIETLDKLKIDLYKNKTVEFSKLLKMVYKGERSIKDLIKEVEKELHQITTQDIKIQRVYNDSGKPVIGICPQCGKNIYENKKGFACSGYRDDPPCNFTFWKATKFKSLTINLTETRVKNLLKGKDITIKKLKGKDGNLYTGTFNYTFTGKYINLKLLNFKKEN